MTYDNSDGSCASLLDTLAGGGEEHWLACAQELVLRGNITVALRVLSAAVSAHPRSTEVRLALAGVLLESDAGERAEALLRAVLADNPDHAAAAFLLTGVLKGQGRMAALADVMRSLFRHPGHDPEQVIRAIELLDDCERKQDASDICEAEIAEGSRDPRLYAYAGMLLSQLGQFELSRRRREFAIANSARAVEWQVPQGLADLQRYASREHPDFALFDACLQQADLSAQARTSLLFAMGKAHDDIGEYAAAARYWREANTCVNATARWPRKQWRRSVEARLARHLPVAAHEGRIDWIPVFIVGAPRSGTTLLAQRLARHPEVCHRGELPWLPMLAEQMSGTADDYHARLATATNQYAAQLRQDDSDAHWFIDKQPHNFMHVDLILRMFPQARIVYCERNARDNALSLWMQSFQPGTQGFAYDFADIAAFIHGSRRLMKHWTTRYPASIYRVPYEQLTADPAACFAALSAWLALPTRDFFGLGDVYPTTAIGTASLWQARQPIHTRSVGRWRRYAEHIPELAQLPDK